MLPFCHIIATCGLYANYCWSGQSSNGRKRKSGNIAADCRLQPIVDCSRLLTTADCWLQPIVGCSRLSTATDCWLQPIVDCPQSIGGCNRLLTVHSRLLTASDCWLQPIVDCSRLFTAADCWLQPIVDCSRLLTAAEVAHHVQEENSDYFDQSNLDMPNCWHFDLYSLLAASLNWGHWYWQVTVVFVIKVCKKQLRSFK